MTSLARYLSSKIQKSKLSLKKYHLGWWTLRRKARGKKFCPASNGETTNIFKLWTMKDLRKWSLYLIEKCLKSLSTTYLYIRKVQSITIMTSLLWKPLILSKGCTGSIRGTSKRHYLMHNSTKLWENRSLKTCTLNFSLWTIREHKLRMRTNLTGTFWTKVLPFFTGVSWSSWRPASSKPLRLTRSKLIAWSTIFSLKVAQCCICYRRIALFWMLYIMCATSSTIRKRNW